MMPVVGRNDVLRVVEYLFGRPNADQDCSETEMRTKHRNTIAESITGIERPNADECPPLSPEEIGDIGYGLANLPGEIGPSPSSAVATLALVFGRSGDLELTPDVEKERQRLVARLFQQPRSEDRSTTKGDAFGRDDLGRAMAAQRRRPSVAKPEPTAPRLVELESGEWIDASLVVAVSFGPVDLCGAVDIVATMGSGQVVRFGPFDGVRAREVIAGVGRLVNEAKGHAPADPGTRVEEVAAALRAIAKPPKTAGEPAPEAAELPDGWRPCSMGGKGAVRVDRDGGPLQTVEIRGGSLASYGRSCVPDRIPIPVAVAAYVLAHAEE